LVATEPSQAALTVRDMSTKATKPEPDEWMRLLTGNRLQKAVSRSVALEAGALGVRALAVAITLIVIGKTGVYDLSIVALLLLGLAFGLGVHTLQLPSAEATGPSLATMRNARDNEDAGEFEDSLLYDLEEDLRINDRALARKRLLFKRAVTVVALAVLVELVGLVVQ
jgi:hypothetical protein